MFVVIGYFWLVKQTLSYLIMSKNVQDRSQKFSPQSVEMSPHIFALVLQLIFVIC